MGRIFAAASWRNGKGRSFRAEKIVESMAAGASGAGGGMNIITASNDGVAAAGIIPGGRNFIYGVSQEDHGVAIISFLGAMPGLETLFKVEGLDIRKDTGANLIALYRKYNEAFLEKLPGMFCLAIYDGDRSELLVAGDRNGYFPVYYVNSPEGLAFSSLIDPLTALNKSKSIDRSAAVEYLFFDALYGSRTFYPDIHIIPYGGWLKVGTADGSVESGTYFSYEGLFDISRYKENRNIDAPSILTEKMGESIGRILGGRDENDFGLMCGGGVDCSYIGGILNGDKPGIPMFCVSIVDGDVSEEDMVRETSERLGSDFHSGYISQNKYYPLLLKSILDFGQPIAHPNLARFYAIAQATAAEGRSEQILGVASDLLFGGQANVRSFYKYLRLSKLVSFLPANLRRLMVIAAGRNDTADLELRLRNPLHVLASAGMGNMERASARSSIEDAVSGIDDENERAVKMLMIENLCDYQQHLLNRRYAMSSGQGIGLWFPFLDTEVVKFAINLPVRHCVDWKTSKKVVRKAAAPYLGGGLASRAKWGGDIPVDRWIAPLTYLLKGGFLQQQLDFDPVRLAPLLSSQRKLLWNMVDIELWGRLCLFGQDPEDILNSIRKNGLECDTYESVLK
jgi:asparagine synthase (glutamine-hydrolysing)